MLRQVSMPSLQERWYAVHQSAVLLVYEESTGAGIVQTVESIIPCQYNPEPENSTNLSSHGFLHATGIAIAVKLNEEMLDNILTLCLNLYVLEVLLCLG